MRLAGTLQPNGPRWLSQPEIAEMFTEAILYGEKAGKYALHAFVVMPNHVHVVLQPTFRLPAVTQWLKSRTGRVANRMLGRAGAFWLDESYDRVIRDSAELYKTIDYVHRNPVRAGLVEHPEDWPWSSACVGSGTEILASPKWHRSHTPMTCATGIRSMLDGFVRLRGR